MSYRFLFEELVKRDFKSKYKRTVLGMLWSVLSPLCTLFVMKMVFSQLFGRNTAHYTTYLFCGNLLFSYYKESTSNGMEALVANASIFTKVNVPKYSFLLSKNVSTLINFSLTLVVFFIFVAFDGLAFTPKFLLLLYPILCLVAFNIGMGLILSALYVFFRDMHYLYDIFTLLQMYLSAIFYTLDSYPPNIRVLFNLNPIFVYIDYFRSIVIRGMIPSPAKHALAAGYAIIALLVGAYFYKKYNRRFLYYV
jgi:ABC-2 type transport system permease protein